MVNKLCLGTVQFGMKYGIKNEIGRKPTNQEVFNILDYAIKNGVEYIDTASAYGDAENVLGEFGIRKYKDVRVVSKMPMLDKYKVGSIDEAIKLSLSRMKLEQLDAYMLHCANDFYNKDIMRELLTARFSGIIKNIGVSIYEPQDALAVAKDDNIDYIQIPYNVFDQRLNATDFFELAQKNKIRVFARSSFLQGLLLMNEEQVPKNLKEVEPYIKRFSDIVSQYGFSRLEAAFLFVYTNKNINNLVFGVDSISQIKNNIDIIKKQESFNECRMNLLNQFNDIDERIVMPNLW